MRYPWANILLLLFILADMLSGFFGLISGSQDRAIYILVHRVSGYGILAVLAWKVANIARSFKWPKKRPVRIASLALAVVLAVTLALGLVWSIFGDFSWWMFSGLSWHIYAGVVLAPLLLWHGWYMFRGPPISFWAERRSLLRLGGLAVAGFLAWQLSEGIARAGSLAGSARRFTGSYEAGSFSGNDYPVVSWLNDHPQPINPDTWSLRIFGEVENELTLTYADLTRLSEETATIDCTGGWFSKQRWDGASLSRVLSQVGPSDTTRSVLVRSVTGYYRRFPLDDAQHFLLATHVTGERLSHGHGFPVRLVAPGRRGFEWVKWVTEIEITETPSWWQPPLPTQ